MKTKAIVLLIILTVALAICVARAAPISTNGLLALDYATNSLSPDLSFNFFHTTNLNLGTTNWPLLTNIFWTNMGFSLIATNPTWATLTVPITIQPGMHFYLATASNYWGETDPSNLCATNVPIRAQGLKAQKGP